jgi:hypothetical protein
MECPDLIINNWYFDDGTLVGDVSNNKKSMRHSFAYRGKKRLPDESKTAPTQDGLQCLPYVYLLGQPNCGSTDFYVRLTRHPLVIQWSFS